MRGIYGRLDGFSTDSLAGWRRLGKLGHGYSGAGDFDVDRLQFGFIRYHR